MKLELAATCAVIFGSLYTVFRKYQCVVALEGTDKQFNQPMVQAFIIFAGMTSIYFFRPFIPKQADQPTKKPERKYIYFLPSFLDVIGTILDTTGLFYTSVSVSQMLKGSALFFTYLITISFGKKTLKAIQHLWMIAIVLSLGLIGYSNADSAHHRFESSPLLGNSLIILSQLIFALMFIAQQKITKNYNIQVSNAVLWEGIWGVVISGIFLVTFANINSDIIKCDIFESCSLMFNNWKLLGAVLVTCLCIGPFNYFGLMITKNTSALQRCMVCTSRMIVVWMVSLIFSWEYFSFMQLFGYLLLTYGIYEFNRHDKSQQKIHHHPEELEPMKKQKLYDLQKIQPTSSTNLSSHQSFE